MGAHAARVGASLQPSFAAAATSALPNTPLHLSSQTVLPPWTAELMLCSRDGVGFVFKAWGKHSLRQSGKLW